MPPVHKLTAEQMASVVAIMVCDYWLLTKGNVFVSHLYVSQWTWTSSKSSRYMLTFVVRMARRIMRITTTTGAGIYKL